MKNIFDSKVSEEIVQRINQLNPGSKPLWGKMTVGQMLAHCCVSYEFVFENKHKKLNPFMKFIIKLFVKDAVVNEKPYKKGSPTAPEFLMKEDKDFEFEKKRLINYILKSQELGVEYFVNKESRSFGKLSKVEWNNMFYKHIDHHLQQFGV